MNKRVLVLNIIFIIVSFILLIIGIHSIMNSGDIATKIHESKPSYDSFARYMENTKDEVTHYVHIEILKGTIFSLFSLCGFIIGYINLNKELSK